MLDRFEIEFDERLRLGVDLIEEMEDLREVEMIEIFELIGERWIVDEWVRDELVTGSNELVDG